MLSIQSSFPICCRCIFKVKKICEANIVFLQQSIGKSPQLRTNLVICCNYHPSLALIHFLSLHFFVKSHLNYKWQISDVGVKLFMRVGRMCHHSTACRVQVPNVYITAICSDVTDWTEINDRGVEFTRSQLLITFTASHDRKLCFASTMFLNLQEPNEPTFVLLHTAGLSNVYLCWITVCKVTSYFLDTGQNH